MNPFETVVSRLSRRLRKREARKLSRDPRDHDLAVSEERLAAENQIRVGRLLGRRRRRRYVPKPHVDPRFARPRPMVPSAPAPLSPMIPLLGHERYIEIGGARLRVSVDGHGPPLLLINGLGANIELWQPLRAQLRGRQTVAFDSPGVGGSPRAPRLLRMHDLAEILDGLLSQLGLESVDVLGYSLGGAIAQEFARQYPRRVRRLVLAATTPGIGAIQNPLVLLRLVSLAMRRETRGRRAAVARVVGGQVSRDLDALVWVERAHRVWPIDRIGLTEQVLGMTGWTSLPWLHNVAVQTLVLAGEEDPLVPPVNTRIFVSRLPFCRWHLIPRGGHLFLIDQAADAAGVIDAFLVDEELPAIGRTPSRLGPAAAS